MTTSLFTFGQAHRHEIDGVIFDKDVVVRVKAPNPRQVMIETFGLRWSMEYPIDHPPRMELFPRGIIDLTGYELPEATQENLL